MLTQTQKNEIQDKILLAVHNTNDIFEAKIKEAELEGCERMHELDTIRSTKVDITKRTFKVDDAFFYEFDVQEHKVLAGHKKKVSDLIGLLPTLSRVLHTLENAYFQYGYIYYLEEYMYNKIQRNLLTINSEDATLRDQSEETQETLYNLICK